MTMGRNDRIPYLLIQLQIGSNENASIKINRYGAQSTRAAATSSAEAANVSVKAIMDATRRAKG